MYLFNIDEIYLSIYAFFLRMYPKNMKKMIGTIALIENQKDSSKIKLKTLHQ